MFLKYCPVIFLLSAISCTSAKTALYNQDFVKCETHILADSIQAPEELLPLLADESFSWPDECEGNYLERGIEILEIDRIRKNKEYKFRYISSSKKDSSSITMIGGAQYKLIVFKDDVGILRFAKWEFILGEI